MFMLSQGDVLTADTATDRFSTAYGRLMMLSGRALHDGHDAQRVGLAMRGRALNMGPTLTQIARQRTKVNQAIMACRTTGVDRVTLLKLGRAAKTMAEAEWGHRIPITEE